MAKGLGDYWRRALTFARDAWGWGPGHPLSGETLTAAIDLRRQEATATAAESRADQKEALSLGLGGEDPDDHLFRRLTTGKAQVRRNLAPLHQDKMIEIAWFLWEGNPFAKRLITLMTDLVVGEGVTIEARDERVNEIIDKTFNHRINQVFKRIREFYNSLALNGELILTVAVNPVTGMPTYGFIDPYQVLRVETQDDNVLVLDTLVLKALGRSSSGLEGQSLKIVRENPATGILEGEVFYFAFNKLPNSTRGRSDLMPLADWLDLYDQYMFAEVERLHMLSSFVWDYQIKGLQDSEIQEKKRKFPKPKPGSVWIHNEKETLEAKTPDLQAADRSEIARMLRVHIAGSTGFPTSYLGDIDSNRSTIEGQNDVMMKTPSARQREFRGFLGMLVEHSIQSHMVHNPGLFREADTGFDIVMPEIAAKDVTRVGGILANVAAAMDTSLSNKTMSQRAAVKVMTAIVSHLGVDLDPMELQAEIDEDAKKDGGASDLLAQALARARDLRNPPAAEPQPDAAAAPAA